MRDGTTTAQHRASKPTPPKPKLRAPKTAAVILTPPPGEGAQIKLEEAVHRARVALPTLDSVGIKGGISVKRAITGGYLLEIPGENDSALADRLAERLREIVGDTGVRVTRPVKTAEVRVTGLMVTTTPEEVAAALAKVGECSEGAITVGVIRQAPSGMGTA